MSQSVRQSELFAGEDWTSVYQAFTNINFSAYDFGTIRQSMVDYIKANYSESFNDWSDSSEFVAYLDLLAYLGQMLAYRIDLNAHENFMDTAARRESIIRLAKYLGYYPQRNYPASGLVKITSIVCNQNLFDSNGNNINNVLVQWNSTTDANWFEKWILIFNSVAQNTNPFGVPLTTLMIDGILTQLYALNSPSGFFPLLSFSASINGQTIPFEIVNVDIDSVKYFVEREPDSTDPMHIIYQNDGNGNSSPNTGFFFLFKQGTLNKTNTVINDAAANTVITLNADNINQSDMWVQTLDNNSNIIQSWTRVGWVPQENLVRVVISDDNIVNNNIPITVQYIYQDVLDEDDTVSIKFGDGNFGAMPVGNIRIWYRTSAGTTYVIQPDDIQGINVTIPYMVQQIQKQVVMSLSLQESIGNSAPAETNDQIKRRAAEMIGVQGRMVTGDDYNTLPAQNTLSLKIKAINRFYSGQSRFIDINDPTGNYNAFNLFADDGALYVDLPINTINVNLNSSANTIISKYLQPLTSNEGITNFLYFDWLNAFSGDYNFSFSKTMPEIYWKPSTNYLYSSTGFFFYKITDSSGNTTIYPANPGAIKVPNAQGIMTIINTPLDYMDQGSLVKFKNAGWTSVISSVKDTSSSTGVYTNYLDGFNNLTQEGAITLNKLVNIDSNGNYDILEWVLPPQSTVFSDTLVTDVVNAITDGQTFGIGFDFHTQDWYIINATELDSTDDYNWDSHSTSIDSSWLIMVENTPTNWNINYRIIRFIFESSQTAKFYFDTNYVGIDPITGKTSPDKIILLDSNLIGCNVWQPKVYYKHGNIVKAYFYDDNGNKYWNYYQCIAAHESGWFYYTVNNSGISIPNWWTSDPNSYSVSSYKASFPDMDLYDGGNGEVVTRIPVWRQMSPGIEDIHHYDIISSYTYKSGALEPRRVIVLGSDEDKDGFVDNPQSYEMLIGIGDWVILELQTYTDGTEFYEINETILSLNVNDPIPLLQPKQIVHFYTNIFGGTINPCNVPIQHGTKFGSFGFWMYNRDVAGTPALTQFTGYSTETYDRISQSPTKDNPYFLDLSTIGRGNDYQAYKGRTDLKFQWRHYAPLDHRLDPMPSNLIDIFVLTTDYYQSLTLWNDQGADPSAIPLPPSTLQLAMSFSDIEQYKMFSDEIIWRPVSFTFLFGAAAEPELQATFMVVRIATTNLSDGEIQTQVISLIQQFFDVSLWDFGETFYATSLIAYIHKNMPTSIASVTLVPTNANQSFGDLFEIPNDPDKLFFPVVTVDNVQIISSNTATNLKITH